MDRISPKGERRVCQEERNWKRDGLGEEKLMDSGVIEELGRNEGAKASRHLGKERCHGSELVSIWVGVAPHGHGAQLWEIPLVIWSPSFPRPLPVSTTSSVIRAFSFISRNLLLRGLWPAWGPRGPGSTGCPRDAHVS